MKRMLCALLSVFLLLALCSCGKKQADDQEEETVTVQENLPFEVKMDLGNLYTYFEYTEIPTFLTDEDGDFTSIQIAYGLKLRDGYTAADLPDHKDTMKVTFKADGVLRSGSYTVDFKNMQYTGTTVSESVNPVTATLDFWPQGDRTIVYTFGNISTSYIMFLQNFTITQVTGSVYLKLK